MLNATTADHPVFIDLMSIMATRKWLSFESMVKKLFPDRDAAHIIRVARKDGNLTKNVRSIITAESHLATFPDKLFGWSLEFSLAREAILKSNSINLPEKSRAISERLVREKDESIRVILLYFAMLCEYMLVGASESESKIRQLNAARTAVSKLKEEARQNSIFSHIGKVNHAAIGWSLIACGDTSVDERKTLLDGQTACKDAADTYPKWVAARVDEMEYSATLHIKGESQQLFLIDNALCHLAKCYLGSPVNYVVRLIGGSLAQNENALSVLDSRPIFQLIKENSNNQNQCILRMSKSLLDTITSMRGH